MVETKGDFYELLSVTKDGKEISFEEVYDKIFLDVDRVLDYVASMSFWGVDDFVEAVWDDELHEYVEVPEGGFDTDLECVPVEKKDNHVYQFRFKTIAAP